MVAKNNRVSNPHGDIKFDPTEDKGGGRREKRYELCFHPTSFGCNMLLHDGYRSPDLNHCYLDLNRRFDVDVMSHGRPPPAEHINGLRHSPADRRNTRTRQHCNIDLRLNAALCFVRQSPRPLIRNHRK
jgi:hypothetical protein